jgi:hypothetical protein
VRAELLRQIQPVDTRGQSRSDAGMTVEEDLPVGKVTGI